MSIGIHTSVTQQAFNCEVCNFGFKDKALLVNHENIGHRKAEDSEIVIEEQSIPFRCDACDFSVEKEEILELHKKDEHEKEAPITGTLPCSKCNEKFKTQDDLNNHINQAHQPKEAGQEEIDASVGKCGTSDENKNLEVSEPAVNISVACPFCKEQTADLTKLKMHIENLHSNNENIQIISSETCFKCVKCDFFGSKT